MWAIWAMWCLHQQQGLELLEEKWKEELRWFTEPRPLLCCGLRLHQELHAREEKHIFCILLFDMFRVRTP